VGDRREGSTFELKSIVLSLFGQKLWIGLTSLASLLKKIL